MGLRFHSEFTDVRCEKVSAGCRFEHFEGGSVSIAILTPRCQDLQLSSAVRAVRAVLTNAVDQAGPSLALPVLFSPEGIENRFLQERIQN
jgi:hypothetical protein